MRGQGEGHIGMEGKILERRKVKGGIAAAEGEIIWTERGRSK